MMNRKLVGVAVVCLGLFIFQACGSEDRQTCESGRQIDCTCAGGATGFQKCLDDGSGWGECECGCVPDCEGRVCGPDGCGSTCPPGCGAGEKCDEVTGLCEECNPATVRIENDFDNTDFDRQPPWTICKAYYQGASFENIGIGDTSGPQQADPGIGYVLMVCSWDDTSCVAEHCLPIASENQEETLCGGDRTIVINVPNHQEPCPPEALGIPPIPEELYNQILDMWPEYNFFPYDQRIKNPQCQ